MDPLILQKQTLVRDIANTYFANLFLTPKTIFSPSNSSTSIVALPKSYYNFSINHSKYIILIIDDMAQNDETKEDNNNNNNQRQYSNMANYQVPVKLNAVCTLQTNMDNNSNQYQNMNNMNIQPQVQQDTAMHITSNTNPNQNNQNQQQQKNTMNNHIQAQNMNNNIMNNMHYTSSDINNNQQQQQTILNQNDILNAINQYLKPCDGQHDRFKCVKHDGLIDSGKKIKSCLKYLLDTTNNIGIKATAGRLNERYNYSCIVYQDLGKWIHADFGGIEVTTSMWSIINKKQTVVGRCQILIIHGQKDNMKTGDHDDGSNEEDKIKIINQYNETSNGQHDRIKCIQHGGSIECGINIKLRLQHLLDNEKLNISTMAEILEEDLKYSCIVFEDTNKETDAFKAGHAGIKAAMSAWSIKDKDGSTVDRYVYIWIIYGKMNINQNNKIATNQPHNNTNMQPQVEQNTAIHITSNTNPTRYNKHQQQQPKTMRNYKQVQNMSNNMSNMYYVSSGTNNNQNHQQQQDFIIDQNDTLNAINEYLKPSNGQHDRFECTKHEGSIKSGMKIKSCLKYLSDNNLELNVANIADRLNKEYNRSCVVYEDSKKNINFDAGGIKSRMSKWLIYNQRRDIVARCHILIIYGQKDNMSGHCGSMEIEQNIKSCLKHLLDNYQINARFVAQSLEKAHNYSCIVWEGEDLKERLPIAATGIEYKPISRWLTKDTFGNVVARFAILIISKHIISID